MKHQNKSGTGMKRNIKLLVLFTLIFTSCTSPKKVLYLQDVDQIKEQIISQKIEMTIQKDDALSIAVSSRNPELSIPFNIGSTGGSSGTGSGYTVDVNGEIDFPVFGKIQVVGLTRMQLQEMIKNKLIQANYISDPIVTVQFVNFKFSVLGEVGSPGVYQITGDRITLFEAISKAGDLTQYGRRDRVAVIRENDSIRTFLYNDLRSTDIFNSPYYYLHQNDIIYVEPNKAKMQSMDRNIISNWMFYLSVIMSITTFSMVFIK